MMIDTAKTVATLRAAGVPHERAVMKAEETGIGWVAAIFGAILMLAGVTIALILVLHHELTIVGVIAVGMLAGIGLSIFGIGISLVARDAAPLVKQAGEWLVALVGKVRSKAP